MFSAHFGRRVKRRQPISNPTLSDEQRAFEGEFVLFANACRWNLTSEKELLCDSSCRDLSAQSIKDALGRLVGRRVDVTEFWQSPTWLRFRFDGGFCLALLPEAEGECEPTDDIFTLSFGNVIWCCDQRGQLGTEVKNRAA
jgi:hypothetical protein